MFAARNMTLAGAFSPLTFNPALWLSDTGSNVAQWDDLSGNGRHATQAVGANQPSIVTNALNGRQVRRFGGVDDFLTIADRALLRNLSGATIFSVINPSVQTAGDRIVFSYFTSTVGNLFYMAQNGAQLIYGGRRVSGTAGDFTTFGTVTASVPRIVTTQQRWSTAQKEAWITQGQTDLDASFQTLGNSENANSAFDPCIGKSADTAINFFNGDIAEIIIYQTALSTSQRQGVELYLSQKYNILL